MEQNSSDPFTSQNCGTARFIDKLADNGLADVSGGDYTNATASDSLEFQTMKPGIGQKPVHTLGRTEIPHSELVKMLYFLEGELQARDVVIAALRNERVKQYICQLRTKRLQPNDPYAAIFRDKIALGGNMISRESSTQVAQAELEVRQIIEQQMEQQYQMVSKQRATHLRMVNILTESLENNQKMLQELEEEKRKHEHDTAQGDDITYGLELERTMLRQELEEERFQFKKLEKEMKKIQETLDYERNRQKQIVLLLIAERKKILMKYIEEGKRSEDLAQILAEEKQRSDTIADGLEEESKKSLRMEEELEKQSVHFANEKKILLSNVVKEETRVKELEQEVAVLRAENEALKKQQLLQPNVASGTGGALVSGCAKPRTFSDDGCATPIVNIAKVVQPTATVSSVPVSGPTTGIARAPNQTMRNALNTTAVRPSSSATISTTSSLAVLSNVGIMASDNTPVAVTSPTSNLTTVGTTCGIIAVAPPSPASVKMQPTATIQRAPGGKYAALAAATVTSHSLDQPTTLPHPVPIAVPPVTVPTTGARGAPPPIPPNKPIVPPKREPPLSRLNSIVMGGGGASGVTSATANAKIN